MNYFNIYNIQVVHIHSKIVTIISSIHLNLTNDLQVDLLFCLK